MCMCILKHSRSCEVKGMAEVRDVETRRETISGIIGAYERDMAIEGYSSVTSSC